MTFQLNDDDVVSMDAQTSFAKTNTSQILQFRQALQQLLQPQGWEWLYSGIACRILKTTGGGWRKGKMYIRLEFVPDEPDEPTPEVSDAVRSPNQ